MLPRVGVRHGRGSGGPAPPSPRTPGFRPCCCPSPWGLLSRMEHSLGTLLNHLWAGRDHPRVQPELLLPTGDPAPSVPAWALPTCQGLRPTERCLLELGLGWRRSAHPPQQATLATGNNPAQVLHLGPGGQGRSQASSSVWTLSYSGDIRPSPPSSNSQPERLASFLGSSGPFPASAQPLSIMCVGRLPGDRATISP